jgi:phosphomethylpyrimidine synthase
MKITQEVRDFAAKQNQQSDSFLAAHPEEGSTLSLSKGESPSQRAEEAEAGMAEMSERFREEGSELYVGAGGREHD